MDLKEQLFMHDGQFSVVSMKKVFTVDASSSNDLLSATYV